MYVLIVPKLSTYIVVVIKPLINFFLINNVIWILGLIYNNYLKLLPYQEVI